MKGFVKVSVIKHESKHVLHIRDHNHDLDERYIMTLNHIIFYYHTNSFQVKKCGYRNQKPQIHIARNTKKTKKKTKDMEKNEKKSTIKEAK